jgi:lysophospholipase L1-like esterase/fibronectin type 3 domain-containing protein
MTLRQVVRVSIPGDQIRLKLSNLFGASSMVIQKVHLAQSTGGHTINTGTDLTVTFSSSESVTIPAGGTVTSDALTYDLPALTNMAITIYFGSTPSTVSGHVGSRTTSYWQSGDAVAASSLTSPSSAVHWYFIDRIDVYREDDARAVVAYGDSITDGYGTTTDAQNRWTDFLATRLQGLSDTNDVGVLNAGIGATLVSGSGLNRLQRDVLDQTDVSYLILLYGVNDILFAGSSSSTIISAYQSIISDARDDGILVYGSPIMPFGDYSQYTPARETVRQEVNTWVRNTNAAAGGFDAVIDFDAALRDSNDNTKLLGSLTVDGLHPNPDGYEVMADAIELALFSLDETPPAAPTGLTATAQSYNTIDLDWDNNSEADFSYYNVKRSETTGGPYSQITTVTDSNYSDASLSASTTYYYVVTAVDFSSNESTNSAEVNDTTFDAPDDNEPPTPNPATWLSTPSAISGSIISMTATTGSDAHGPVQYSFEETSSNPGGTDSGWQSSSSYTDTGLSPTTMYTYRVRMRDDLNNIGGYSSSKSAITLGGYEESGGVLSMEAENGMLGSYWMIGDDAGASNGQYIEIDPAYNCTEYSPCCTTAECIVTYEFNISTSGNYRFWFFICSNSYDDDSFFWRIDSGSWVFENSRFAQWASTDNTQVDNLSTGSHVLKIAYRENGTRLDKFVIQLDSLTAPSGDGPPESDRSQGDCSDVQGGGYGLTSDINDDCYVDSNDLSVIANYWLYTTCAGLGDCENADLEPDGDVDLIDFSDFAIDWLSCNYPGDSGCLKNW